MVDWLAFFFWLVYLCYHFQIYLCELRLSIWWRYALGMWNMIEAISSWYGWLCREIWCLMWLYMRYILTYIVSNMEMCVARCCSIIPQVGHKVSHIECWHILGVLQQYVCGLVHVQLCCYGEGITLNEHISHHPTLKSWNSIMDTGIKL